MNKTKECRRCHEVKPVTEFNVKRYNADGYHSYCRKCQHEKWSEFYDKNRESILEKQKLSEKTENVEAPYKWCIRCHARIPIGDSSIVVCKACDTRLKLVPDYAYRHAHGVRLKVMA